MVSDLFAIFATCADDHSIMGKETEEERKHAVGPRLDETKRMGRDEIIILVPPRRPDDV